MRDGRVCGVNQSELELHLAGYNTRLLAGTLALEGEPARLLLGLLVLEDLLERQIKLSEIILAKTVLVPAYDIEDQTLYRVDGQLFDNVPFGIQRFGDGVGDNTRVAKRNHEIL